MASLTNSTIFVPILGLTFLDLEENDIGNGIGLVRHWIVSFVETSVGAGLSLSFLVRGECGVSTFGSFRRRRGGKGGVKAHRQW